MFLEVMMLFLLNSLGLKEVIDAVLNVFYFFSKVLYLLDHLRALMEILMLAVEDFPQTWGVVFNAFPSNVITINTVAGCKYRNIMAGCSLVANAQLLCVALMSSIPLINFALQIAPMSFILISCCLFGNIYNYYKLICQYTVD